MFVEQAIYKTDSLVVALTAILRALESLIDKQTQTGLSF